MIAAVVPLSALTYHFVENPFRRAQVFKVRRLRGVLLYPAVVVLTLPMLAAANNVVEDELTGGGPPITIAEFGQGRTTRVQPGPGRRAGAGLGQGGRRTATRSRPTSSRRCSTSAPTSPTWASASTSRSTSDRPLCPRGDTDGDKTLVLIGDSHARQWVPALDELSKRYGYTAYFLIREGCPSSDVTPWMVHGGPSTDCEAFQDWARQQVEELQPDVVLLGSEANRRGFTDRRRPARERRRDDGDDVPRGHGAARSTTSRRTPAGSS